MNISDNGIRLIESFEGWHKLCADGRYMAYQDSFGGKLDKPTIGPGLTEGVEMGMVWTRSQCENALRRELAKHEAAVTQAVTVPISQNAYDALVSFSYNVGSNAMRSSTVIRSLNAGEMVVAANAFLAWNKAGGVKVEGLMSRRMREAALFLKPDAMPTDAPWMPQTLDEPKRPLSTHEKVLAGAAAGGAALETAKSVVGQAQDVKSVTSDAFSLIPAGLTLSWIVGGLFGALLLSGVALIVSHLRSK